MSKFNLKKYKLWTDTLNEENLCETIGTIDFTEEKPNKERGVESYKYENKQLSNKEVKNKRQQSKRRSHESFKNQNGESIDLKDRIGPKITYDETKPRKHIKVTEIDSDDAVAKEIVRVLREPKDDVIQRCVKILGKKKCLELLYATEDIEESGGLPTSDAYRRRTPGGVFFQLLKRDETILNCQRSKIFIEDVERKKKQKALKRLRQRQRFNEAKKVLEQHVKKNDGQPNEEDMEQIDQDFESQQEENMIYFDE